MYRKLMMLPLLALIAACGKSYDLPASTVSEKLSHTNPPMKILASLVSDYTVSQASDGSVHWTFRDLDGSALARLTATVEQAGANSSSVSVHADPPESGNNSTLAKSMEENPQIVSLLESVMREQIDAELTDRPFNRAVIQSQLSSTIVKSIPKMQDHARKEMLRYAESTRDAEAPEPVNDADAIVDE